MKKTFIFLSLVTSTLFAGKALGQIVFQATDPVAVEGFYNFSQANGWAADLNVPSNAVSGLGVIVDDGTAADSLGCGTLTNGIDLSGNIAFVYRGTCEFGTKAFNAQTAGAIGVVVINNTSGTIVMGPGAAGGNVTIPVIMISQETGAILRPYLDNGTLEVFIGSKLGLLGSDLGMKKGDVFRPLNYATPSLLASANTELQTMQIGSWVRNYGSNTQTDVTLTATISLNGTDIYDESTSIASLASGDSTLLGLPNFSIPNANVAKYTLTYTVTSDSTDEENSDNEIVQDFYITDGAYTKSRYDAAANKPIRTSGLTAADDANITWGILMNAVEGSKIKATGIQFSASTAATDSLTGEIITGILYEWDDANADGGISDDELTEIAIGFYSYQSNLQNEILTIDLDDTPGEGPALADNKVYYIAIQYEGNKTVFMSVDEDLDYNQTINQYNQSINPLLSGGAWYGGGFGSEYTLSLALNTAFNNVSIEENGLELNLSAYPNPAKDAVNLVFGNAVANADVQVKVVDVTGRAVMNTQYNITTSENYVTVNTADMAAGTYYFSVSVNNKTVKTIPVVIAK